MQDRIDNLQALTGLPVICYTESRKVGTVNYFVFGHEHNPIITVCTYRKALAFAQGFESGRSPVVAAAYPPGGGTL